MYIFLALFSIVVFHIWADRTRFRELYSSALAGSYVRLLMQYVGGEKFEFWKYKNLPFPIAQNAQIPFLLDFTIYPIAAFLFIQWMPQTMQKKIPYYLLWVLGAVGVEVLLELSGYIELKKWNYGFSFIFFLVWALFVEWQYRMFKRWCLR